MIKKFLITVFSVLFFMQAIVADVKIGDDAVRQIV